MTQKVKDSPGRDVVKYERVHAHLPDCQLPTHGRLVGVALTEGDEDFRLPALLPSLPRECHTEADALKETLTLVSHCQQPSHQVWSKLTTEDIGAFMYCICAVVVTC